MKELYRWVFAREPNAEELQVATSYIKSHEANIRGGYEDIVWALINTKEFQFNH